MRVPDIAVLVVAAVGVTFIGISIYGKYAVEARMGAAVQECIRLGGVPLTTERHTYCMAKGAMIGFPSVHPK